LNILQITSHLNIGGITRYVLSLTKRLIERGHRVIIASDHGHAKAQLEAAGATHWHLPLHTSVEFSPQVFWAMRQLAARLTREPVDIIHAHTRVGQLVADCVSRRVNTPYVTTWHGIYKLRIGRRLWPCTGRMTIAISELVRLHLLNDFRLPPARIRCIYNGVDAAHYAMPPDPETVQAYRARWQLPSNQPIVGTVGRLASGRVKGFDTLLAAANILAGQVPKLHVLIVGDGPRRSFLEDIARRLGIHERVHFVGETEDVRIPLALMDLFVFSSRWPEAFGLALVEAMAAGKPVVATQAGAVLEIIRHGVDGWLVPADDPSSMADGIVRLLEDRLMANRLGRNAQERVCQAFGLDRMTDEIEALYREAAGQID
jgi:glycosyltransferase involved in cell wall biosynthesis